MCDDSSLTTCNDCRIVLDNESGHMSDAFLEDYWAFQPNEFDSTNIASNQIIDNSAELRTANLLDDIDSPHGIEIAPKAPAPPLVHDKDLTTSGLPLAQIRSVTVVPRRGSKQPELQNWEQWRPMIMATYEHATAQTIIDKIRSNGFYVT